jgi:hypothetical protein
MEDLNEPVPCMTTPTIKPGDKVKTPVGKGTVRIVSDKAIYVFIWHLGVLRFKLDEVNVFADTKTPTTTRKIVSLKGRPNLKLID